LGRRLTGPLVLQLEELAKLAEDGVAFARGGPDIPAGIKAAGVSVGWLREFVKAEQV
jgi:hypothetical protein